MGPEVMVWGFLGVRIFPRVRNERQSVRASMHQGIQRRCWHPDTISRRSDREYAQGHSQGTSARDLGRGGMMDSSYLRSNPHMWDSFLGEQPAGGRWREKAFSSFTRGHEKCAGGTGIPISKTSTGLRFGVWFLRV